MISDDEIRAIAHALMDGGWTADDRDLFVSENYRRDEQSQMSLDEIDAIFDIIEQEEA